MPAARHASISRSMIRTPCTRTRGLGVLKVIGTMRLPKPAAINTARFTRYGSRAAWPAGVTLPDSMNPASVSSFITLFAVPREQDAASASSRWVMGDLAVTRASRISNCFLLRLMFLILLYILRIPGILHRTGRRQSVR